MFTKIINAALLKNLSVRLYSKNAPGSATIVLTDDRSTYVAWHPQQDFPYECTRPLPEPKIEESTSVLKTNLTPELMQIFKKKTDEQARQELMNITFTTKHRWFPRARDKRAKKTPMDREYL
ncbi:hypothetical protein RI129_008530 [Pyrocoelia pectoralis]|uniref:Large ribosomal subunit protein mL42 n=1 Tax=Pyrocoelia pectoralis TaxID=417401 RepID=A0AAN7VBF0_9COLE